MTASGGPAFVTAEVVVACQGIEDLPTIREVGLESKDARTRVWEVSQVDIEDLVATLDELRNAMPPSLA
jgi:hypothetical protein